MEVELFDELHGAYQKQWDKYISEYTVAGEQRSRPYRIRKDGALAKTEDQLFFVLHYLKSNSIQEHHAAAMAWRKVSVICGYICCLICCVRHLQL